MFGRFLKFLAAPVKQDVEMVKDIESLPPAPEAGPNSKSFDDMLDAREKSDGHV